MRIFEWISLEGPNHPKLVIWIIHLLFMKTAKMVKGRHAIITSTRNPNQSCSIIIFASSFAYTRNGSICSSGVKIFSARKKIHERGHPPVKRKNESKMSIVKLVRHWGIGKSQTAQNSDFLREYTGIMEKNSYVECGQWLMQPNF